MSITSSAIQALYSGLTIIILITDARRMRDIITGPIYRHVYCQYQPGRYPVIWYMSSVNLSKKQRSVLFPFTRHKNKCEFCTVHDHRYRSQQ